MHMYLCFTPCLAKYTGGIHSDGFIRENGWKHKPVVEVVLLQVLQSEGEGVHVSVCTAQMVE